MMLNNIYIRFFIVLLSIFILSLAVAIHAKEGLNKKVVLNIAKKDLAPEELLNIGIVVFDGNLSKIDENSDLVEIRKAEANYLPYHLKLTLEDSGHWGGVWLLPNASRVTDLIIVGKILQSDGLNIKLQIGIWDVTGKEWISKEYSNEIKLSAYSKRRDLSQDPYQIIFNRIANDILDIRNTFSSLNLKRIEEIGEIRYSNEILPGLYNNYLEKDKAIYKAVKLPAENDTMISKVRNVKERELLLLDTINEHYGLAYQDMSLNYEEWREETRQSAIIYEDLKRQAKIRKIMGATVLLGAIAADGSSNTSRNIQSMGMYGGIQAIQSGMSVSKKADSFKERISEEAKAFNASVQPTNIELEGKTVRLAGNADEMFTQWRILLKSIYTQETGSVSLKSSID